MQGAAAFIANPSVGSAIGILPGIPGKPTKLTKEIKIRANLGRDGSTSRHIVERMNNKTNSVTHQVKKEGKIIHQHQTHIGKYGTERQFPDEWIEYPSIPSN